MTDRRTLDLLFATLLLTAPCYFFLVFCAGFLPVGAMIVFVAGVADSNMELAAIAFAAPPILLELGIYAFLLRLLTRAIVRRLPSDAERRRLVLALIIAGCAASTVLPINHFDCMDGHGLTPCSALQMYFGWTRTPQVPESTLYSGARCGDFGW